MTLNTNGKLEAAVMVFYAPIALLALALTIRHGFKREAGWIFLLTFSIIRIVGGAMMVAAQSQTPPSIDLYTGAVILESVGLSPLLLATMGFVGSAGEAAFGENKRMTHILRVDKIACIIAMILSIVGGIDANSSKSSTVTTGTDLRKGGILVFIAVYVLTALCTSFLWRRESEIGNYYRKLLVAITVAMPLLAIRLLYGGLSTYSATDSGLAKFNGITGEWWIQLLMSLLTEYLVVLIYIYTGFRIPKGADTLALKSFADSA